MGHPPLWPTCAGILPPSLSYNQENNISLQQNALLEAQCHIVAGISDAGLPSLVELIVTCRLKISIWGRGKSWKCHNKSTSAEIPVIWEAQDDCLLWSPSSKSRVAFSWHPQSLSSRGLKGDVHHPRGREVLAGLCSAHSVKALLGKCQQTIFHQKMLIPWNRLSVKIKGQFFLIFSNSKYCGSFKWKKKPRKALLERCCFFSLLFQVVTLLWWKTKNQNKWCKSEMKPLRLTLK